MRKALIVLEVDPRDPHCELLRHIVEDQLRSDCTELSIDVKLEPRQLQQMTFVDTAVEIARRAKVVLVRDRIEDAMCAYVSMKSMVFIDPDEEDPDHEVDSLFMAVARQQQILFRCFYPQVTERTPAFAIRQLAANVERLSRIVEDASCGTDELPVLEILTDSIYRGYAAATEAASRRN